MSKRSQRLTISRQMAMRQHNRSQYEKVDGGNYLRASKTINSHAHHSKA